LEIKNINVTKAAFIPLTISLITLLGCINSQSTIDWRNIRKLDSIDEYEKYVGKWPASRYIPKANERLETLYRMRRWKAANTADSFSSYETYLRLYPFSYQTREAFTKLRRSFEHEHDLRVKADWVRAQKTDSVAAYEEFLVKNPGSPFITDARKRLEAIGKAPLLEAIWEEDRATREKRKAKNKGGKQDVPALMLPVVSDDDATYLIYKNHRYMYEKITEKGIEQMPPDYELLNLRYQKPYRSFVFFINQELSDASPASEKKFNPVFSKLMSKFMDVLSEKFGYKFDEVVLWVFLPNIPDILEAARAETFSENILLSAQTGNKYRAALQVEKPKTLDDTFIAKRLVEYYKDSLYEPQDITEKKAVKTLLFFNVPRASQALRDAGETVVVPLIRLLGNKDSDIKARAASILTDIGEPAVMPLISYLPYPKRRRVVISILEKIGDPRAIQPLVNILVEWDIGRDAASTLKTFNWSPASSKEHIHYAVAKRNRSALLKNWTQTKEILLAEVVSRRRQKIKGALYAFIAIGKEEIIPVLINTLKKKGNKIMAETYLNSGSRRLSDAATTWAYGNGYSISRGSGANDVSWGSF